MRRELDDERAVKQRAAQAASAGGFATVDVDESAAPGPPADLRAPLKLVCEPGVRSATPHA